MIIYDDLDNIFGSGNPHFSKKDLQAIQTWRNAGNLFVIVTGYNHAVLDQILPNWQSLVDYIITDNGGAIFSNQNELVHINELSRSLIRQIQSLVCDRATPISYSPYRCSIELMLTETAIKLRLWFKTEPRFRSCKSRIEAQGWPVKVLSQIGTDFSALPSGASTERLYGFLDIIPISSGKDEAIAQLSNIISGSEEQTIIVNSNSYSIADIIYRHP